MSNAAPVIVRNPSAPVRFVRWPPQNAPLHVVVNCRCVVVYRPGAVSYTEGI